MKINVSKANDLVLNYLVANAEGLKFEFDGGACWVYDPVYINWVKASNDRRAHSLHNDRCYSTDWAQGGPIIDRMGDYCQEGNSEQSDREKKFYCSTPSVAEEWHSHPVSAYGPTPLIAAMRCYVISKLGAEVDVPDELM